MNSSHEAGSGIARNWTVACLVLFTAACSEPGDPRGPGGDERTISEDALHVVSHEVNGEPTLGSVRLLAWGPDGEILVFDQLSQRIEVYDSAGWVRSIGGPGAGPAGFSPMVTAMVPLPQGVAVVDFGNGRVSVIDYSGEELEQQPLDVSDAGIPVHAEASPSDQLLVQFRGGDAEGADPIWILWPTNERGLIAEVPSGLGVTMSGGGAPAYRMLAPEVYWAPTDDGVYVAGSHEYTVRLQSEASSREVFTRALMPEPVTSADVSAVRQGVAEELGRTGLDEAQVESFLESLDFHDTLPVIAWMTVSSSGEIWVQRGGSPAELAAESGLSDLRLNHGSAVWDRWGPGSSLIETVRFPPRFMPMQFAEDAALGVLYDELGRERVAVAPF